MNVVRVDALDERPASLSAAAEWLRAGGVVAFPTDTLYGLAVDPRSGEAVARLFAVKRRPAAGALPLVAASAAQAFAALGEPGPDTARLASRFWPGPLSLLFDAPASLAPAVHAGTRAVAVRVPAHPVARALAAALGHPITATSANLSGEPPATSAAGIGEVAASPHVLVVDAGAAPGGAASTLVDARTRPPMLLRDGATPWDRVLESLYS